MFSTGKRDNFIKEQLHIHVISFNKLNGGELYEILVPHVQVSLNARTKHVHLFHCLQNHTSKWPVLTPKGRLKITRTLHFKLQNPSQSCILNTHASFIQPYSVIAPFSFWKQVKHNKRKWANWSAFIINGKARWEK